jgi:hypothetical protein
LFVLLQIGGVCKMKLTKLVAISISILIGLALVPTSAYAAEPQPADVVIIIDVSNSMDGEPLEAEKLATDKFAQRYGGRIAIVTIGNSANIALPFTADKAKLSTAIEQINCGGGTNINDGLKLAQILFDDYSASSSKIILLMSDGAPSAGDIYADDDARYKAGSYHVSHGWSQDDYEKYASAAYNTAKSITGIDIASIRFLPTASGNYGEGYIALGRDFMNDISTLGCLNAATFGDLAPAANLLADVMNQSVDMASLADAITDISESLKDPSSQNYIFGRDYNLPFRYAVGDQSVIANMPVRWDLDLFDDSSVYNHELAKACMTLCDNNYDDFGLLSQNLRSLGFDSIERIEPSDGEFHSIHFLIAHQKITLSGVEKNLMIVIASGTSGLNEWLSNFSLWYEEGADYGGFGVPARYVAKQISEYQGRHDLSTGAGDNIFIMTGHSRGGAVTGLATVYMLDNGRAMGDQMFAYTAASPNTTTNLGFGKYDCIFNVVDGLDPVVRIPPYAWRYGTTLGYGLDEITSTIDFAHQDMVPIDLSSIAAVRHHFPDTYMIWMAGGPPSVAWKGRGWYYVSIDCQVNVEVLADGATIALIENGIVDEDVTSPDYLVWTVGYGKRLMLPDDQDYQIVITATGSGTMDYRVEHLGGSSDHFGPIELASDSFSITTGDGFEATIASDGAEIVLAFVDESAVPADDGPEQNWLLLAGIGVVGLICGVPIGAILTYRNRAKK